jgi:Flp pilus assembly pilin Flp
MPSSLKTLTVRIHVWLTQDAGQALTEYALILALIALVTITALSLLSGKVTAPLSTVGSSIGS